MPMEADTCSFKAITLYSSELTTIDTFKHAIRDGVVEVWIGGQSIVRHDFSLLIELAPIQKVGTAYTISIPSEYTMGEVPLVALAFHEMKAVIEIPNAHLIENVRFFANYTFHEQGRRYQLAQGQHESIFQNIRTTAVHEWASNERSTCLFRPLDATHCVKGYFIEGDLSKIEEFRITFDGRDRMVYDEVLLAMHCHRISDRLTYLSYSGHNDYQTMTFDSYASSANHSRMDVHMNLTLKPTHSADAAPVRETIRIHSMWFNVIAYIGGLAGLRYPDTPFVATDRSPRITEPPGEWPTQQRDLQPDTECPITQLTIDADYCLCSACNNAFDYEALHAWIVQFKHRKCPMCRAQWTNRIRYRGVPPL